jgi:hypothetical protein
MKYIYYIVFNISFFIKINRMHIEHFLVGLIAGLIAMYMIVMICNSCNVSIAGLDNRPRWMMGGLRDDTGSHNANDVYGMGFGLD